MARGAPGPLDAPVEAAVLEHPLDLVGQKEQGRDRGCVVGLILARVVKRGRELQKFGLPAPLGAVELLDARDRGRAQERKPEAALRGKALLRGEVVDVCLGWVERQPGGG